MPLIYADVIALLLSLRPPPFRRHLPCLLTLMLIFDADAFAISLPLLRLLMLLLLTRFTPFHTLDAYYAAIISRFHMLLDARLRHAFILRRFAALICLIRYTRCC